MSRMTQIVKLNKLSYYRKDSKEVRMAGITHSFILLCLVLSSSSAFSDEASPIAGEIVIVEGKVMIRSEKQGPTFGVTRVAEAGGPIYPEDVINTSSLSKIKILLKDKSIVDLGPSSLFKVDHFDNADGTTKRKVDLSMAYGTMRAAVSQKVDNGGRFKVKTPSATMGVRGTEFLVQSDLEKDNKQNSTTQVTVLQGEVGVGALKNGSASSSSPVIGLTAGMQMQTTNYSNQGLSAGSTSKPQSISASQMSSMSSSFKLSDNTFKNAVTIDPQSGSSQGREPASSGSSSSASKPAPIISIAIPAPPPITPADLGVPGAFHPSLAISQTPVNPLGVPKRLHVVIQTP